MDFNILSLLFYPNDSPLGGIEGGGSRYIGSGPVSIDSRHSHAFVGASVPDLIPNFLSNSNLDIRDLAFLDGNASNRATKLRSIRVRKHSINGGGSSIQNGRLPSDLGKINRPLVNATDVTMDFDACRIKSVACKVFGFLKFPGYLNLIVRNFTVTIDIKVLLGSRVAGKPWATGIVL